MTDLTAVTVEAEPERRVEVPGNDVEPSATTVEERWGDWMTEVTGVCKLHIGCGTHMYTLYEWLQYVSITNSHRVRVESLQTVRKNRNLHFFSVIRYWVYHLTEVYSLQTVKSPLEDPPIGDAFPRNLHGKRGFPMGFPIAFPRLTGYS